LAPTDCLPMKNGIMEQRLRREAKALLEQGKVSCVIGFEAGSLKFTTTPLITGDKDDTQRLVISPFMANNLSVFLTGVKGRVAIVAKGCDSRSIVSLIQDNKVVREDVVLLGEPTAAAGDKEKAKSREKINSLETMKPDERWAFWRNEFSRCIRCYACRNVCPACFCERCFVEETEPPWVLPIPRWQDSLMFQVVRNLHVAGRCTDCGECERACPVGIPLRSLAREMYDIVGELFSYRAGMDKEAPPLLACYEPTDVEDFIR